MPNATPALSATSHRSHAWLRSHPGPAGACSAPWTYTGAVALVDVGVAAVAAAMAVVAAQRIAGVLGQEVARGDGV